MIDDTTNCVLTTGARTRVSALVPDASLVSGTITVEDAFWPATPIRIPLVFRKARTDTIATLSVGAARARVARVRVDWLRWRRWFEIAISEWVTGVTIRASAYGCVIDDATLSSNPT